MARLGFNRAYEQAFGVKREDLIGKTVLDLGYLTRATGLVDQRVVGMSEVVVDPDPKGFVLVGLGQLTDLPDRQAIARCGRWA